MWAGIEAISQHFQNDTVTSLSGGREMEYSLHNKLDYVIWKRARWMSVREAAKRIGRALLIPSINIVTRNWTWDPPLTSRMLYQLSYRFRWGRTLILFYRSSVTTPFSLMIFTIPSIKLVKSKFGWYSWNELAKNCIFNVSSLFCFNHNRILLIHFQHIATFDFPLLFPDICNALSILMGRTSI